VLNSNIPHRTVTVLAAAAVTALCLPGCSPASLPKQSERL